MEKLTKKKNKSPIVKPRKSTKKNKSTKSRYKLNVSLSGKVSNDVFDSHITPFIKLRARYVLEDILKNLKENSVHKTMHISHDVYLNIFLIIHSSSTIKMSYNNNKLLDISFPEKNIMTLESTTSFLDHFGGFDEKNERLRAKRASHRIITESCHWIRFEKDGNKRVVTIDLGISGQDNFMANKILIITILILLYQDGMENYNGTIPPLLFTYVEYFRRNKVLVLNYDNENYEWK
jgi:hypothetical protein